MPVPRRSPTAIWRDIAAGCRHRRCRRGYEPRPTTGLLSAQADPGAPAGHRRHRRADDCRGRGERHRLRVRARRDRRGERCRRGAAHHRQDWQPETTTGRPVPRAGRSSRERGADQTARASAARSPALTIMRFGGSPQGDPLRRVRTRRAGAAGEASARAVASVSRRRRSAASRTSQAPPRAQPARTSVSQCAPGRLQVEQGTLLDNGAHRVHAGDHQIGAGVHSPRR